MSKNTKNYKLYTFTNDSDVADLKLLEPTFDTIDKGLVLDVGESTGSGNNYILNLGSITLTRANKGISFKFWSDKDSKGAITINGTYKLIKANGSSVTNLKAGAPYTITYDGGTNFFLASGGVDDVNFSASDLLTGKTANNSNGEKVNGTMPNKGAVTQSLSANGSLTLPSGYYDSIKVTQSLTTKGATTWKPSTKAQSIPSGTYLTGTQTIQGDANLAPQNIRAGISIFGVGGALTIQTLSLIKSGSAIVAGAGGNLGTFTGGLKIIFTYEVATSKVYVSFLDPSVRSNELLPFRLIGNTADLFNASATTSLHGHVYWYWYKNELLINRGNSPSYDGKEFKYKIFDLGYTMSSIKSF